VMVLLRQRRERLDQGSSLPDSLLTHTFSLRCLRPPLVPGPLALSSWCPRSGCRVAVSRPKGVAGAVGARLRPAAQVETERFGPLRWIRPSTLMATGADVQLSARPAGAPPQVDEEMAGRPEGPRDPSNVDAGGLLTRRAAQHKHPVNSCAVTGRSSDEEVPCSDPGP
jgi:hypothetical protein